MPLIAPPPGAPSAQQLSSSFEQFTLWRMAPEAVGFWNQFQPHVQGLQWLFVVGALIGVAFLVSRMIKGFRQ
jgi:hypothetical protein